MKKLFYETGTLNWMYVFFAMVVGGFLISFFTTMIAGPESIGFFSIHNGDKNSLFKIWKLATYGFFDPTVFSVISNLIWLWIFGGVIDMMLGNKRVFALAIFTLLTIGLLGGIACLLLSEERFYIFLNGIDVAAVAIAAAAVYKFPQFKVSMILIGAIPLWMLGVVFILMRVFINPAKEFAAMLVLYFIAMGIGIFFMRQLYNGKDITDLFFDFRNFLKLKTQHKPKVVQMPKQRKTSIQGNSSSDLQLDAILDKISTSGMSALTDAEKKYLKKMSET